MRPYLVEILKLSEVFGEKRIGCWLFKVTKLYKDREGNEEKLTRQKLGPFLHTKGVQKFLKTRKYLKLEIEIQVSSIFELSG